MALEKTLPESIHTKTTMAETAARHVNTMEAHHAPNWSRKQHVDGAHDKPSATSPAHPRYLNFLETGALFFKSSYPGEFGPNDDDPNREQRLHPRL